uniref:Uncharacterized protein n=1 Tax=Rhizophora mucronata TaxID=61149 RepID=A0A2P2P4U2_RHIMU
MVILVEKYCFEFMVMVLRCFSIGMMRLGHLSPCQNTDKGPSFSADSRKEGLKSSFMLGHYQPLTFVTLKYLF